MERLEPRVLLAGDGLAGEYFDGSNFSTAKLHRIDATVNFDYGSGSPDVTIGSARFRRVGPDRSSRNTRKRTRSTRRPTAGCDSGSTAN